LRGCKNDKDKTSFDLAKFKYHINLYDRFLPLAEANDQGPLPVFQPVPDSYRICSGDIGLVCGHMRSRQKLKKKKSLPVEGRKLSESSL
jgi:hypothetical protein